MILLFAKAIKRLPILSYWGRYSIIILCTHGLLLNRACLFLDGMGFIKVAGYTLSIVVCFIIVRGICTALIPLCIKYIPKLTAQKDFFRVRK